MNPLYKDQGQYYDIIAQTYTQGGEIAVDANCNGWTAINTGDIGVTVCGIMLKPYPAGHPELTGAAIAIPGNKWEVFSGRIWIVFEQGGADPQVTIIQKFYK
jgi:hypothetical protein